MPRRTDRTFVVISRPALLNNLAYYRARCDKRFIAVCKDASYGHGGIAPFLQPYVDAFAVATLSEGIALRRDVTKPILLLGYVPIGDVPVAAENGLTLSAYDVETVLQTDDALERAGMRIDAHIKINTGMNRLGLCSEPELLCLKSCKNIDFTGIYTHYAVGPEDQRFRAKQTDRFFSLLSFCEKNGFSFDLIHAANSKNALLSPVGNAVRLGIGLYGYGETELSPALRWYARVVQVRDLSPGETVGYDRTYTAHGPRRIAVLSVGYGDGYPRALSQCGSVLFRGKRLPIAGRVCMDATMIDCTGTDLATGDYVLLLGSDGDQCVWADDLGFGYETLCRIAERVPRYVED